MELYFIAEIDPNLSQRLESKMKSQKRSEVEDEQSCHLGRSLSKKDNDTNR